MNGSELLPSWSQSDAKSAVLEFAGSVSRPGASYVPPADRIAAFDNGGMLCGEKPQYAEAEFIFRRWKQMAQADPAKAKEQPYKAPAGTTGPGSRTCPDTFRIWPGQSARTAPGWPDQGAAMRRQCPEPAAGQRQEHVTMTAEPSQSPVSEAVLSLEVRWIFPGQLDAGVARWFARFPATTESREDTYLLDPHLPGLSVKVRAGAALEVKAYRGSPGILQVPGRARGRMQAWQKWSFPCSPPRPGSGDQPGWQPVRKRRRISRFPLASGPVAARGPGPDQQPRCAVELTEIRTRGQDWWTLGFETTGPADLLRSELQATAALVFAHALPGSVEPGPDQSRSYAEWLSPRPGAESHA